MTTSTPELRLTDQPGTLSEKLAIFASRRDIVNLLGIRYLISAAPPPMPHLQSVFTMHFPQNPATIAIYDNADARPLVYFADALVTMPENEDAAFERLTTQAWPGMRTLLECGSACSPAAVDGRGTIQIDSQTDTQLRLTTHAASAQWLIVNINQLPGWSVTLDGAPQQPVMANSTFFGIAVPAGSHAVSLTYSLATLLRQGVSDVLAGKHQL